MKSRRRGSALYATVLSTALIVSLLGVAGLTLVRIESKQLAASNERTTARMNAHSAVELALRAIADDPNWRTTYSNGVETTPQSLHADVNGTLSWILEDTDGSLTDADTKLRLKGVGRAGQAVQVSSVAIEPIVKVPDALQCAVYCAGDMALTSCSAIDGPLASGATLTVSNTVAADVEGDPVILGGTVTGTIKDPGPDRTLPPAGVYDTYLAMATTIPFGDLPLHVSKANTRQFKAQLLSPSDSAYSAPNPNGVYHFQVPSGWTLSMSNLRIAATVVVELGSNSSLDFGVQMLWDPPPGKNYPALITKSDWTSDCTFIVQNTLREKNGLNLNPPHLPYQGVSNTDTKDQFPSNITGVYHFLGSNLSLQINSFEGSSVILADGPVAVSNNVTIACDPNIYANPPMGYIGPTGDMQVIQGSWMSAEAP